MASIRKVVHRTGRISWKARWRDPTGAQRSKNFSRRIDAERFLTTIEARKLAGIYIDPRAGRIRLGEFTQQATAGWVNRRDSTKARDVYGHLYEGLDRNAADTPNPPWNPPDVDAMWTRHIQRGNQGRGLT